MNIYFFLGNKPIDYFNMLVDENFYELVIRETNHYAEEAFLSGGMLPASRISRWHDDSGGTSRISWSFHSYGYDSSKSSK